MSTNTIIFQQTYQNGASGRNRTDDLLITNQLLYQLSYASFVESLVS